jgi:hypothetical protein
MDQINAIATQFDGPDEGRRSDMPQVHHVKKSRKEFPGVPKGSEYWWWKFAFGPTVRSLKPPRPWQLTRSEFLSEYLRITDDTVGSLSSWDDLENLVSELENLRDETQGKLDNMTAESGSTVELLEARVSGLDEWIDHIDGVASGHEDEAWSSEVQDEIAEGAPDIE